MIYQKNMLLFLHLFSLFVWLKMVRNISRLKYINELLNMATRRDFIQQATLLGAGLMFQPLMIKAGALSAGADDKIREGLLSSEENGYDYSSFSKKDIIPIPENPEEWDDFRKALSTWRTEERAKINYQDKYYQDANYKWTSSAYNSHKILMSDEAFYDPQTNQYTLAKFLNNFIRDFGRMDYIILWHTYPLIGLDDRNQFDMYRDMPGGLEGMKKICDFFHSKDIKVMIEYNPWDIGTRRENISDIDALCGIIRDIDADGIYLDTMDKGGPDFREKLDAIKPGIVMETEHALPLTHIFDHHFSWAQDFGNFTDRQAPGILRNKWFEPRHIQHRITRFYLERSRELHTAWMNGSGIMIWENIFGQWNGWSNRDKSILRTISPIQKRYTDLFTGGEWIPMADPNSVKNIYSNLWKNEGTRLWTLVNRSEDNTEGQLLHIELKPNENYYDLIRGIKIKPRLDSERIGIIDGVISARGVGCFLAVNKQLVDNDFTAFLKTQAEIYKNATYDQTLNRRTTLLKSFIRTEKQNNTPPGMVIIPAVKKYMHVDFRVREVGFYKSLDETYNDNPCHGFHYPRENTIMTITKKINISRFAMDETPVTNKQFETFMKATGYQPAISVNFLRHWENGNIPDGKGDHPVVYVDLNDARAYARWAGKRLPTEEEWQWAAQGDSDNKYPWGNEMKEGYYNPDNGDGTTPVYSYPKGKSPWGCYDMCGNVWELNESEYDDGRNRFCILKGGSFYKAKGSLWYFDGGPLPVNFAAKKLLMYPGLDRCATIGFRCAVDLI
jgi:formylglycine-generating enzyme required for sulfatase activity